MKNRIQPEITGTGEIILDVLDIFDNISDQFKLELMERLSCEDVIIKHIMDQVLHGSTENGYSGSEIIDDLRLSSELQKARENLRKKGNRLLVKEINRLRDVIADKNNHREAGWNEYHKLYNKYVRGKYEY